VGLQKDAPKGKTEKVNAELPKCRQKIPGKKTSAEVPAISKRTQAGEGKIMG